MVSRELYPWKIDVELRRPMIAIRLRSARPRWLFALANWLVYANMVGHNRSPEEQAESRVYEILNAKRIDEAPLKEWLMAPKINLWGGSVDLEVARAAYEKMSTASVVVEGDNRNIQQLPLQSDWRLLQRKLRCRSGVRAEAFLLP